MVPMQEEAAKRRNNPDARDLNERISSFFAA